MEEEEEEEEQEEEEKEEKREKISSTESLQIDTREAVSFLIWFRWLPLDLYFAGY